jgi:hypothetical protein
MFLLVRVGTLDRLFLFRWQNKGRKIDHLDSASLRRAELQRGAAFGRVAHNSAAA